jgi:hypothetical protein
MTCRDDADHFDIILFAHGMSHHQHQSTFDNPYRPLSLFAVFDTILFYQRQGRLGKIPANSHPKGCLVIQTSLAQLIQACGASSGPEPRLLQIPCHWLPEPRRPPSRARRSAYPCRPSSGRLPRVGRAGGHKPAPPHDPTTIYAAATARPQAVADSARLMVEARLKANARFRRQHSRAGSLD